MTPRRCETCRYFDRPDAPDPVIVSGGRCRRNPPELLEDLTGEWPRVHSTDWCGSWANAHLDDQGKPHFRRRRHQGA